MIAYLLLGLVGLAITLVGTTTDLNWLIPIGAATIFGAFFWSSAAARGRRF